MLLQRLVEYAAEHTNSRRPFHRERVFSWQLELAGDGSLRSSVLTPLVQPDAKGRLRGTPHTTPSAVRTVGVAANLAADDVQYVLGWPDEASKPDRVARCHDAFVDLTQRWADSVEGRDDPVAQAVAAFYRAGGVNRVQKHDGVTAKQGVLIAVDGAPAYEAASVMPFWTAEVAARKGGGTSGLCLVCGQSRPLMDTVPGKVRASLVPGASNDAALVSINERVFGYDLVTQLAGTPLCLVCGEAFSAGLVGVLESPYVISYGDQDSRMAWWVTGGEDNEDWFGQVRKPDPSTVEGLLSAVRRGERVTGPEKARFCSLAVGGNVARVVVREWIDMPLEDLVGNVAAWFRDHEVVPQWRDGRRHHPLFALVLATGRWQKDRNRYAEMGARGAGRPPGAQRDLIKAVLRRAPVPPSLLAHVLHRVTSDGRMDDARAALIRLCLNPRSKSLARPTEQSPPTSGIFMSGLDPENTDPYYVSGRLFAELEQLQYDASGGKLNTAYGDRYFAGAVTNPRAALVNGRKDAKAWLKKLRRDTRGTAVTHEKRLDELFALIDGAAGLPARTSMRQQAAFLLGYHHQRADHFARLPRKTDKTGPAADMPADSDSSPIEETA